MKAGDGNMLKKEKCKKRCTNGTHKTWAIENRIASRQTKTNWVTYEYQK